MIRKIHSFLFSCFKFTKLKILMQSCQTDISLFHLMKLNFVKNLFFGILFCTHKESRKRPFIFQCDWLFNTISHFVVYCLSKHKTILLLCLSLILFSVCSIFNIAKEKLQTVMISFEVKEKPIRVKSFYWSLLNRTIESILKTCPIHNQLNASLITFNVIIHLPFLTWMLLKSK